MKTWKKLDAGIGKKSIFALAVLFVITFMPFQTKLLCAQEIVTFPSEPTPISPFKLKKAKASGITLTPTPGIMLTGHLFRPKADERRPAVIILLSGDGLQTSHLNWAKLVAEWGYVALVIDSFRSRGGTETRDTPSVGMPADAMNGARYLKSLEFVEGNKIGLIGFSMGGSRLFSILGKSGNNKSEEGTFALGVSFYPNCIADIVLQVPLLVLAGDNDDIMSLGSCTTALKEAPKHENDMSLIMYSGATHYFDNPNYRKDIVQASAKASRPVYFLTNHYDQAAHKDSIIRVRDFLKKHIGQ